MARGRGTTARRIGRKTKQRAAQRVGVEGIMYTECGRQGCAALERRRGAAARRDK